VGGERIQAFVLSPLPPNPPVAFEGRLHTLLESAVLALGRLDAVILNEGTEP